MVSFKYANDIDTFHQNLTNDRDQARSIFMFEAPGCQQLRVGDDLKRFVKTWSMNWDRFGNIPSVFVKLMDRLGQIRKFVEFR